MKYFINKKDRPVYLQLYKQIRDDIVKGAYPYNSKLPSQRVLAADAGVSTVTVEHAYELLCDEGYAQPHQRSGYKVIFRQSNGFAPAKGQIPQPPVGHKTSESHTEYPAFPVSTLSRTMRKVLSDHYDVILEKSPNCGLPQLRGAIKNYLARNRGVYVETGQIIVGSGAEYLYGLIVMLLGKDRVYAVESPSYEVIEKIYAAAGVRYELLPLAADGIETAALCSSNADVLHTTPYRSFPSGVTASASKRHEYISWAGKNDRFIIESDYGSEFAVASQPMETLFALSDRDNVIYMNTFSKTISSSMRFGYMVLPQRLTELFSKKLGFYSCTVPTFEQYVLAELINSGNFERHINRVRRKMRKELENRR